MSKKRGPNKSEDEKRGFNFPGGDGLIELVLVYGEQAAYSGAATTPTVFVSTFHVSQPPVVMEKWELWLSLASF